MTPVTVADPLRKGHPEGMLLLRIPWKLFELVVTAAFLGTPLVGVWLASSLTAYLDGPRWLAWVAGFLMFPLLPVGWELRAWRKRRKIDPLGSKTILSVGERLALRTFVIGLVFIGALLATYPRTAFIALSTRGDWMLDGRSGPEVDRARKALFKGADLLEGLYRATRRNPYESLIEQPFPRPRRPVGPVPTPQPTHAPGVPVPDGTPDRPGASPAPEPTRPAEPAEPAPPEPTPGAPVEPEPVPLPGEAGRGWPWSGAGLHPAVTGMPPSAESSLEAAAQHIALSEPDQMLRIKALHDYVADRIAYDAKAFFDDDYPPQDARTVFEKKIGVCAGYANLLSAMASEIGEEILVVEGDARSGQEVLGGNGHAWSAARVGDRWYLIDATWDSGSVDRKMGFEKSYSTSYLFAPPEVFAHTHFPSDARWQLRAEPISRGDFLRLPHLRPTFFAMGLELLSPRRTKMEVRRNATIQLKNPQEKWILVGVSKDGVDTGARLQPVNGKAPTLECPLSGSGDYRLTLFVNDSRDGTYEGVGSIDFLGL